MQLLFLSISLTRYTLSLSVIRQLRNELNERELAAASFQGCTCAGCKIKVQKAGWRKISDETVARGIHTLSSFPFCTSRTFARGIDLWKWSSNRVNDDRPKATFSQVESNLENENSHERLKTFPSRWLNFRSKKQICFCLKLDVNIYFKSLTSISLRKFIWNV